MRIVCFGPGPKFKGGIANYNTSLAKALDAIDGNEVHIVSWTQQYPAIIPRDFIDRKSRIDQLAGTNIKVHYITNYNKPSTWRKTYRLICDLKPEMVIFQWAIAIQGLPLGSIAKKLKRKTDIEVIFDLHFVVQKENSSIDRFFTRKALKHAETFVIHAQKTYHELQKLFPEGKYNLIESGRSTAEGHSVIKLFHPVYDMFKPDPELDIDKLKKELKLEKNVFLFFGFIRKYKGLHFAIEAFAKALEKRKDISLLIVGEAFWNTLDKKKFSTRLKSFVFGIAKRLFLKKENDEKNYRPMEMIDKLGISNHVSSIIDFVPNEEVHKYFQVSDSIVLFYEYATPSGVESMAYNFKMPILATKVGHFPETVIDGFNGYLADAADTDSMAEAMLKSVEQPINSENVARTASEMSWRNYATAIISR